MNPDPEILAAIQAKLAELRAEQAKPLGPFMGRRGWHVMHEGGGDPWTLYFGHHRGAGYLSVDIQGFNGWASSKRMPGGWEYYAPGLSLGRLGCNYRARSISQRVLIPAKVVRAWRWSTSPTWRRLMREMSPEEVAT